MAGPLILLGQPGEEEVASDENVTSVEAELEGQDTGLLRAGDASSLRSS